MSAGNTDLDVVNDARMFASRAEHKYFLRPANAQAFVDGVTEHLGAHRFRGADANRLPRPVHYVTTLYFDTDANEIAQACEAGDDNVKLRAREYYDEHPDLTELATSPAQVVKRKPEIWLEVKARTGANTRKVRFALSTHDIANFLPEGVISERTLVAQRSVWGEAAEDVFAELSELCAQTRGPLRPDCLAHYRRRAWQDPEGELRITLDTRLAFYRPPPRMFTKHTSLHEIVAGAEPVGRLAQYLVEIKLRGDPPEWLEQLRLDIQLEPACEGRRPFSKFLAATHAAHAAE